MNQKLRSTILRSGLAAAGLLAASVMTNAQAADSYALDPEHAQVIFKVERFGLSYVYGSFADVTGALTLDEAAPEKSAVRATIAVASLRSDNATREGHLSGEYWLDAAAFPQISFVSTSVTRIDDNAATVTGDLTLHGVTKPVTLDVALVNFGTDPVSKKKAVGFSATTTINRHDFGVSIAADLIGADVQIFIETLAIKAD